VLCLCRPESALADQRSAGFKNKPLDRKTAAKFRQEDFWVTDTIQFQFPSSSFEL